MSKSILIAALSSLFIVQARAGLTYRIYPLDGIAGGQLSVGDLNDKGSVVGEAQPRPGPDAAVVWNEGIPTHIPLGSNQVELANGINDAGKVVGMIVQNDFSQHGYVWDGKTVSLLPGVNSQALAINNAGEIAGASNINGAKQATIWNQGKPTALSFANDTFDSQANALNDRGDVVGEDLIGGATHAFLYHNGKVTSLPSLGGSFDDAIAVNDRDQIIGTSKVGDTRPVGVVWKNGIINALKPLVHYSIAQAFGINDNGSIVGISSGGDDDHHDHATLWKNGTAFDLNTLLPTQSGWVLTDATAINDSGQIIGIGKFRGEEQPFILTPATNAIPLPSPALIGATMLPLAMWVANGRRRRSPKSC